MGEEATGQCQVRSINDWQLYKESHAKYSSMFCGAAMQHEECTVLHLPMNATCGRAQHLPESAAFENV